jgi:YD repeat-containing protein
VAEKRVDFQYNALGQFTLIRRYNDLDGQPGDLVAESSFSYDVLARLTGLEHAHAGGSIAYAWQFDAAGRIVSFVSPDGTSLYQYDEIGQLVLADHDYQPDEEHEFDLNGNRVTSGYQVGANNRLLSDGVFTYEYDAEGNLLRRTRISSDPADDHVMELEWDHRNRLTRVVFKNNQGDVTREVLYTYDVFDRRIRKQIDWDGEGQGLAEGIACV